MKLFSKNETILQLLNIQLNMDYEYLIIFSIFGSTTSLLKTKFLQHMCEEEEEN